VPARNATAPQAGGAGTKQIEVDLTDRAVRVHMGFPVGLDFKEQYMQGLGYLKRSRPDPISQFTSTVDGRRVAVRLVRS
jgi:hypothetical protein